MNALNPGAHVIRLLAMQMQAVIIVSVVQRTRDVPCKWTVGMDVFCPPFVCRETLVYTLGFNMVEQHFKAIHLPEPCALRLRQWLGLTLIPERPSCFAKMFTVLNRLLLSSPIHFQPAGPAAGGASATMPASRLGCPLSGDVSNRWTRLQDMVQLVWQHLSTLLPFLMDNAMVLVHPEEANLFRPVRDEDKLRLAAKTFVHYPLVETRYCAFVSSKRWGRKKKRTPRPSLSFSH